MAIAQEMVILEVPHQGCISQVANATCACAACCPLHRSYVQALICW